MPKNYIFNEINKLEIKEELNKAKNTNSYKRLQALNLRSEGKKYAEITQITGFKHANITLLISKYFNCGITAITEDKRTGNNRKLTVEQEKDLLVPFLELANAGKILVVAEIKKAYDDLTGEKSSIPTVYNLLKRHGWRKIMPRSKHPKKANDEAIIAYKKNQ